MCHPSAVFSRRASFVLAVLVGLLLFSSRSYAQSPVYRINTGGPAYTDSLGQVWSADQGFNTGKAFTATTAIQGTNDPALFKSERYDAPASPELQYSLAVPNGLYRVNLYFAEIYSGTQGVGKRVFDVLVEATLAFDNLDIFAEVGGYTALEKTVDVQVSDGTLNIQFLHVKENPKINAIEVLALGATNQPPTAVVSATPTSGTAPLAVQFTGSGSSDADGTIASYAWDFGDGGSSPLADPGYLYANAGTYTATLTVTDDGGLLDTDTVVITVGIFGNQPPTAVASAAPTGGTAPLAVQFTGSGSSDVDGTITSYAWDFGDGSGSPLADPSHTYASAGTFTATLTVTDNGALTAADSVVITVAAPPNQPPTAVASATPTSGSAPLAVQFTGSGSSDADGTIASYAWDFGDGGSSPVANSSHTYASAGTFTATLTVTDNGGLTDTDSVAISVVASVDGPPVYRINTGGPAYTDSLGQVWSADQGFNTGKVFTTTSAIQGTNDPALFKNERYDAPATPELQYSLPVPNGLYRVNLYFAEIYSGTQGVGKRFFDVLVEATLAFDNLDVFAAVGGYTALKKTVDVQVSDGTLNIQFLHVKENPKINAIEVLDLLAGHQGNFLHVVMNVPAYAVDYDGSGDESVFLDGSGSHTHELGRVLASYDWSESGVSFASTPTVSRVFALGPHVVTLTIQDDGTPPTSLSDSAAFKVVAPNNVPGSLVLYYEAGSQDPVLLLDAFPANANFGEVRPGLVIPAVNGKIGATPYASGVMVRVQAQVDISQADLYTFAAVGGTDRRLFLDGAPVSGAVLLGPGRYSLEARFAVNAISELPLEVTYAQGSGPQTAVNPNVVTHDETLLGPVINAAPSGGSSLGGEQVTITGLGFFPTNQVVVQWGVTTLSGPALVVTPQSIQLTAPSGTGTITVTVQTPNGTSDSFTYTYSASTVPVSFSVSNLLAMTAPTQGEWGPDGRLYVGAVTGTIQAFTFDDNYNVTAVQTIPTLETLSNNNILGITFNPFDPPGTVRIYVAHSLLFANGGLCFTGFSPYSGQVSVLTGPDFSSAQPLITGLPVSNHDHGINGMQFDNNGDLLIAVGGNTNAGVADCNMGDLSESPLSAAIVKARLSSPSFNGQITYVETATGNPNNDQVFGGVVDVAPGAGVSVFASGFRNPFDLVFTTSGRVYATDNGPNSGFGAASTSATTQGPDPMDLDEMVLLEKGNYYGHPNRNRGRYDSRENVYRGSAEPAIPGVFTQNLTTFPSSTNGIVEYRSQAFLGAMRGNLLAQKLNAQTFRVSLSADGRSVTSNSQLPVSLGSLDVLIGPGGVLLGVDYNDNQITIARPVDPSAIGLTVYDIFPWRAPQSGGQSFVIGGSGFGNLGNTSVTIGGVAAQLTSVSSARIHGVIPANRAPAGALLDVVVTVAGASRGLSSSFRYLAPPGSEPLGDRWMTGSPMPVALAEVAAGVINGKVYVVGEGDNSTLSYDLASGNWSSPTSLAPRQFVGDHHAAEVLNGRLYLIGGLGNGSDGRLQIFDPATNSWSLGADMPFAAGSSSSAVIQGQIYVAGGIVSGSTVTSVAKYDPATDTWTPLAPMPQGRNHAASATDGNKLYVFGGRGPGSGDGNVLADGFDTVQIYDPATDTWVSSLDPGSTLAPLPQARGGMGKAVYYGGEFYVIGGETDTGAGATSDKVYNRVDIYNPVTNTWRLGATMPTARHGIFPVFNGGRILVPGGGDRARFAPTAVHEIYFPQ